VHGAPPHTVRTCDLDRTTTAVGLQALHDARVLHRDIAGELADPQSRRAGKLGDLGISVEQARAPSVRHGGTLPFMAPEPSTIRRGSRPRPTSTRWGYAQ
jgi:serine/threonine protein kinase